MLVEPAVRPVERPKGNAGAQLQAWVRLGIQIYSAICAFQYAELIACQGKLTARAISNKDTGAGRAKKYFAVFQIVNLALVEMIRYDYCAPRQIAQVEYLTTMQKRPTKISVEDAIDVPMYAQRRAGAKSVQPLEWQIDAQKRNRSTTRHVLL